MKKVYFVLIAVIFILCGCRDNSAAPADCSEETNNVIINYEKADEILKSMSLDEKICQMMFVTPESITGEKRIIDAGAKMRAALENYPVGGIIYFAENMIDPNQVKKMVEETQSFSKIRLFIGVDEEGGRVARLGNNVQMNTTKAPPMGKVKDESNAYEIGRTLGKDLKNLMFNVDFAPVADVIVYEKNDEIGDRSFGSDPEFAAKMVEKIVNGLEDAGVSSVLKHFPGHGSAKTNSHKGYAESERREEDLKNCELLPFKAGIEAGCDFVMVSHMTLINYEKNGLPSSLSEDVIGNLLRGYLGFKGIVITDSLSMSAIKDNYCNGEEAVLAIKAGNDMLLMPYDVEAAKNRIMEAVETGEIEESRIDESVRRILRIKIEKGVID